MSVRPSASEGFLRLAIASQGCGEFGGGGGSYVWYVGRMRRGEGEGKEVFVSVVPVERERGVGMV